MAAIAIFGGTAEGRQLAEALRGVPLQVHVSVATAYGESLLPREENIHIHAGPMEEAEMEAFLAEREVVCCLDATHPYASVVTGNIREACRRRKVRYLRIQREADDTPEGGLNGGPESVGERTVGRNGVCGSVTFVNSVREAAEFLKKTEGRILITTGSKELAEYMAIDGYRERCVARVLPIAPVVESCGRLGFEGRNLIGMQGPFSQEMNRCMIRQTGAKWLVTKQSGAPGGYPEKCEAALEEGIGLVIVRRPEEERRPGNPEKPSGALAGQQEEAVGADAGFRSMHISEALDFLRTEFSLPAPKRTVYLVAAGMGSEDSMTVEARRCLKTCDVLIGAGRVLESCRKIAEETDCFASYRGPEIAAFLKLHPEYQRAAVVFSGDIGFYSGAAGVRACLDGFEVRAVSGVASPVYFLDRLGIPWEEVRLESCHGKACPVLPLVRGNRKICLLLGKASDVPDIAGMLLEAGLDQVKMTVGERLSYPEERIASGYPAAFAGERFDPLSVLLLENPEASNEAAFPDLPGIPDACFVRGKTPMTKEEIRVLSLSKLHLKPDSVLYDIGAGTGSVSVEAARYCRSGRVYAVEQNREAAELLAANRERFEAVSMEIVPGKAPDCLEGLEAPTHVFIGGSGGRLPEIIRAVRRKNEKARFVLNAVTLETMALVSALTEEFPEYRDMEIIQVNVSKSRELGRYHLMQAENPIFIISFGGEEERTWQK
ncbi:MAG: precorrin-6Y C5,15-methyltransferase (decarboxylating) subunit CbiT [Lachnospiraceae bacterium]|nr:precorrin-6Y C5,15-methyltransferase (decarboxylating) subunit CbiT [Lachnospiraceae bacterium]